MCQVSPCLETTYKQGQRSGLILASLWALRPLTVLALMKHDHRMKASKNPAGTCWEGREGESGRQEVPTEIANTTTRLVCFRGSTADPKVITIWLGWPGKMRPHRIPRAPSSLASISAPLEAAPSAVLPSEDAGSAGGKPARGSRCCLIQSGLAGWAALCQTSGQPMANARVQHDTRAIVREQLLNLRRL